MINQRARRLAFSTCFCFLMLVGCSDGSLGEVSGTVTVNGAVPADGSSIDFIPVNGQGPSAGMTLEKGKYSVKAPIGMCKVVLRIPRSARRQDGPAGPGPTGDRIEESLPEEYNDKTQQTFDVKPGHQEKNWPIDTPLRK